MGGDTYRADPEARSEWWHRWLNWPPNDLNGFLKELSADYRRRQPSKAPTAHPAQ